MVSGQWEGLGLGLGFRVSCAAAYARCVTNPESTMYSETATWPREKKREVSPRGSAAKWPRTTGLGLGLGLGQWHRKVSGQLRLHRVRACKLCRLRREGSLLHVVASVLRPESCTADDCGREGALAVDMV